jgi:hypothetical protein
VTRSLDRAADLDRTFPLVRKRPERQLDVTRSFSFGRGGSGVSRAETTNARKNTFGWALGWRYRASGGRLTGAGMVPHRPHRAQPDFMRP